MRAAAVCPRGTWWCTEHMTDFDQCVSAPITVSVGCSVWLQQELPGIEPVVIVDTTPSGAELSLLEASDLADAICELRQQVLPPGFPIRWEEPPARGRKS